MSNRHNNFGARPPAGHRSLSSAMELTRKHAAAQDAGEAFTKTPATKQWTCSCGGVNTAGRPTCRYCGEKVSQ